MGGEGAMMQAIHAMKNNKRMLSKREKFKKNVGGYGKNVKPEYNLPDATPEVLSEIKVRLIKERKQRWVKISILFFIAFIGLITLLAYIT